LTVVDPVAAGVTNQALVSFPGFMRLPWILVLVPIWFLLTAETSPSPAATTPTASPSPSASPSPAPSPSPSPSPSPIPSPIPTNAFLSLDVTAGDLNTVINVTGGQFLPNEETTLYWDQPNKVAGAAKADGGGSFNTRVKAFSGDAPGTHKLCASVPPSPCAT